jgi:hypothetical protein
VKSERRGTTEQRIKQDKQLTHWIQLSCHRFRVNEARLQLSLLACNLGSLWRRLVLPKRIDAWSLTSLQQRLAKTGASDASSTPATTGCCRLAYGRAGPRYRRKVGRCPRSHRAPRGRLRGLLEPQYRSSYSYAARHHYATSWFRISLPLLLVHSNTC